MTNQSAGNRRLISMCFLLALVILLMQRAADPRNVSQAFRSLGVPLDGSAQGGSSVNNPANSISPSGRSEGTLSSSSLGPRRKSKWSITCDDLIPRLLDDATQPQIGELARIWFTRQQRSTDFEANVRDEANLEAQGLDVLEQQTRRRISDIQETLDRNASNSEISAENDWALLLEQFQREWHVAWQLFESEMSIESKDTDPIEDSVQLSQEFKRSLSEYLDQRLVDSLRDGAPWRKVESDAFWRLLSRCGGAAETLELTSSKLISTKQLESEAKLFKGRVVRFRGSVRRVELIDRGNAIFDVERYWLIWLRGEDGSAQPVGVYTTDSQAEKYSDSIHADDNVFPELEVTGISAKRLAYASATGVQVAPTLFALEMRLLSDGSMVRQVVSDNAPGSLLIAIILGTLVAGLILLPIAYHWRRSPVPRQVFGKGSKAPGRKMLMFAICVSISCPNIGKRICAQEPVPPWASESNRVASRIAMLRSRLDESLNENDVEQLRQYLSGTDEGFPNGSLKIIHVLKQMGWQHIEDQLQFDLDGANLAFEHLRVEGTVRSAMPVSLSEAQKDWFQQTDEVQLFRMGVENGSVGSGLQAESLYTVFCQNVPKIWTESARLRQPIEFEGLALRDTKTGKLLCLFADSVSWILVKDGSPRLTLDELMPPISNQLALLGSAGWNLAWSERIAANNQKPLQADESEAFYSLIRLSAESSSLQNASRSASQSKGMTPMDAFVVPNDAFARPVSWRVRLVSGSVVPVETPAQQKQLGQDYYFQLDGFVDIGNQRIRYRVAGEDVRFDREFPITIVTRSAESFSSVSKVDSGALTWQIGKFAEVEGFFYRLWSYQSELMQLKSATARQAAPLVVATKLNLAIPPTRSRETSEIGWFGYALCFATLVILAAILYSTVSKDTRPRLSSRG